MCGLFLCWEPASSPLSWSVSFFFRQACLPFTWAGLNTMFLGTYIWLSVMSLQNGDVELGFSVVAGDMIVSVFSSHPALPQNRKPRSGCSGSAAAPGTGMTTWSCCFLSFFSSHPALPQNRLIQFSPGVISLVVRCVMDETVREVKT